jgi:hypothetical protein
LIVPEGGDGVEERSACGDGGAVVIVSFMTITFKIELGFRVEEGIGHRQLRGGGGDDGRPAWVAPSRSQAG